MMMTMMTTTVGDSNGCGGDEEGNLGHEKEGRGEGGEGRTDRKKGGWGDTSKSIKNRERDEEVKEVETYTGR